MYQNERGSGQNSKYPSKCAFDVASSVLFQTTTRRVFRFSISTASSQPLATLSQDFFPSHFLPSLFMIYRWHIKLVLYARNTTGKRIPPNVTRASPCVSNFSLSAELMRWYPHIRVYTYPIHTYIYIYIQGVCESEKSAVQHRETETATQHRQTIVQDRSCLRFQRSLLRLVIIRASFSKPLLMTNEINENNLRGFER